MLLYNVTSSTNLPLFLGYVLLSGPEAHEREKANSKLLLDITVDLLHVVLLDLLNRPSDDKALAVGRGGLGNNVEMDVGDFLYARGHER
jgi:hypothetical protein